MQQYHQLNRLGLHKFKLDGTPGNGSSNLLHKNNSKTKVQQLGKLGLYYGLKSSFIAKSTRDLLCNSDNELEKNPNRTHIYIYIFYISKEIWVILSLGG